MLEDILNGQEKSQFFIIQDRADCCGRLLLLNASLKCLHRGCNLIIVCQERPPKFFTNWLPANLSGRLTCINGFRIDSDVDDLNHDILSAISNSSQPSVILFDSLSPLLLIKDVTSICRFLHNLKSDANVSQVISLLHQDVHDECVSNLLRYQASSVIRLTPGTTEDYICHVRHCRPTGKVLKSTESVVLDDNLCMKKIQPFDLKNQNEQFEDPVSQADPTSQLTFNLSLTDSEKEARSQVVLPYTKERSIGDQAAPHAGGKIHYEPDEADDLDEEDPDDDLNI